MEIFPNGIDINEVVSISDNYNARSGETDGLDRFVWAQSVTLVSLKYQLLQKRG